MKPNLNLALTLFRCMGLSARSTSEQFGLEGSATTTSPSIDSYVRTCAERRARPSGGRDIHSSYNPSIPPVVQTSSNCQRRVISNHPLPPISHQLALTTLQAAVNQCRQHQCKVAQNKSPRTSGPLHVPAEKATCTSSGSARSRLQTTGMTQISKPVPSHYLIKYKSGTPTSTSYSYLADDIIVIACLNVQESTM